MNYPKLNYKTFKVKQDKEFLENERAIIHFITTPDIDEMKEIIEAKGMNDSYIDKTKAVYYMHNYYLPPIGKSIYRTITNDGIIAKTVFAKSVFANDIYNLHKENVINTWSIGWDYDKDFEDYETIDEKGIKHINHWRLYEYSSAPLPMNPNAIDQVKFNLKSLEMKNIALTAENEILMKNILLEYKNKNLELLDKINKLESELKFLRDNSDEFRNEIYKLKNSLSNILGKVDNNEEIVSKLIVRAFREITGKKINFN